MDIKVIKTVKETNERLIQSESLSFAFDINKKEYPLICIFPDVEFQTIEGIGGAFTESASTTLDKMSASSREKILKAYFDEKEGIGYNFCRTHIHSCDFALGNYCYIEENDETLNTFDISRDRESLIPMINDAKKYGSFKLFASPWSPPAFMKDTNKMNNGGKLLKKYYPLWADYFVRYIEEYKKEGIDIWGVTVQNEANATQTWDSCVYTAEEERDFIKNHLGERLQKIGVEIMFWDHNKERIYERSKVVFDDKDATKYASGVAFHWYSGDHFEQLEIVHKMYPDKKLIFSEGCQEHSKQIGSQWHAGERYAHDMIGNFNNYCNAFTDWNLILDEKGGPNHVNNFCDAPITADTKNDKVIFNPSYYYIGHISKFVKAGAKRIGHSKFTDKLDVCSFKNPNGEIVLVVMNREEKEMPFYLHLNEQIAETSIKPHSIYTFLIN